jgi:hypothetical protein
VKNDYLDEQDRILDRALEDMKDVDRRRTYEAAKTEALRAGVDVADAIFATQKIYYEKKLHPSFWYRLGVFCELDAISLILQRRVAKKARTQSN